jgi:hypothetical protein
MLSQWKVGDGYEEAKLSLDEDLPAILLLRVVRKGINNKYNVVIRDAQTGKRIALFISTEMGLFPARRKAIMMAKTIIQSDILFTEEPG